MVPCRLHVPPPAFAALAIVSGEPPAAGTVRSSSRVKKAMVLLSGDQNGDQASSVPSSTLASGESRRCTYSIVLPFGPVTDTQANERPSGEMYAVSPRPVNSDTG